MHTKYQSRELVQFFFQSLIPKHHQLEFEYLFVVRIFASFFFVFDLFTILCNASLLSLLLQPFLSVGDETIGGL